MKYRVILFYDSKYILFIWQDFYLISTDIRLISNVAFSMAYFSVITMLVIKFYMLNSKLYAQKLYGHVVTLNDSYYAQIYEEPKRFVKQISLSSHLKLSNNFQIYFDDVLISVTFQNFNGRDVFHIRKINGTVLTSAKKKTLAKIFQIFISPIINTINYQLMEIWKKKLKFLFSMRFRQCQDKLYTQNCAFGTLKRY